jgi:hypothetical protein
MNIKKIVIATLVTTGLSISVQASDLKAADSSLATKLCVTAASGNRADMYNQVKASGKSAQFVAKNINCNSKNILAFVEENGKNSQNMLKVLDRSSHNISITDIAKNTLEIK